MTNDKNIKSTGFLGQLRDYLRQTAGAIAPMFALMAPVIVGSVGGSIDVAQVYLMKQRLGHALDAAALAAAASETNDANVPSKVAQFIDLNYPSNKIGDVSNINVTVDGDIISASASGTFDTFFLHLIGVSELSVDVKTSIEREVQGIEVVLVLDVTGSMADEIGELEESVENFVNRMCEGSECPENVKIGYVPFSTAVNVGPYGLGEDENGNYYDTAFVNNPTGRDWNIPDYWNQWRGCVMAADGYDTDVTYGGKWDMYRNSMSFGTSYTYYDWESYSHTNSNGKHYYHAYNYLCNKSHIIPLTSDKDRLLAKADFEANGWTLGNLGMVWGLRVLLPEYPFTEGAPYTDNVTKRVIVMMTDGRNDIPDGGNGSSQYSAYGPATNDGINETDLNNKFASLCTTAKNQYGINVYTITFSNGVDAATEQLFETCASKPANYHDVNDSDQLSDVYDQIAKELANLHIRE